jgi:heat shock protein HslJ
MHNKKLIWIVAVIAILILAFAYYFHKPKVETPLVITPSPSPTHVAENPEGEADPSRMKLDMTVWHWISAQYNDGTKITPKLSDKFTLTFKNDGTFSASTDCNGIGGNYVAKDKMLTFKDMLGTLMYCEGSQESDFKKILENTSSYFFTNRGELILELKYDSGTATFR